MYKNKTKIEPFLKWAGGKSQLLSQFEKLYPDRDKYSRYIEPFIGGGAVFFYLQPKKAVINDLNKDLINCYKVVKNNTSGLIKRLKVLQKKHDKEFYYKMREKFNEQKLSTEERASLLIYLNKTCFNGLYRVNGGGKFNVPIGRNMKVSFNEENLKAISRLLKTTAIKSEPFNKVISYAKKNDFVYFDPPYYPLNRTSSFTSYTKEEFLEKEQEELSDVFKKLDKMGCLVMLSNSDTKFIKDLYKGYDIKKVKARRFINCDASKRGVINEVVVRNY
jgi:DNA adenine methylase